MSSASDPMPCLIVDAGIYLEEHPELRDDKSAVLDLAYEEYCQRLEAGAPPDTDVFCGRFPQFKTSLRRLIEAHHFFEENSQYLDNGEPVAWPEPGETFQGFSLLRELGRGAFARVYLAREVELGRRHVAVKVALRGGREAETLGRISHPNIVTVHSVKTDPETGLTVICMPYLGMATLCDVLDAAFPPEGPSQRAQIILEAGARGIGPGVPSMLSATPSEVLLNGNYAAGVCQLGMEIAEALAHIHAMDICHRDLKPSNVLLRPDGRPMLLDFNLSADLEVGDDRLGGTLPYMAPEQLLATAPDAGDDKPEVDARSDLFSLGVLLYELLTGVHPFGPVRTDISPTETRRVLYERHQIGPIPICNHNPEVSKGLAAILEKCLAANPKDRPTGTEAAAALREELAHALVNKKAPEATPRWDARARGWRDRALLGVSVTLVTVALFVIVGAVLQGASTPADSVPGEASLEDRPVPGLQGASTPADSVQHAKEACARGDYDEATQLLWPLPESVRTTPEVQRLFGRIALGRNRTAEAVEAFQKADPEANDGEIQAVLAYCLAQQGRPEHHREAIVAGERAVKLGQTTSTVFNNLAFSQIQTNKLDKAEKNLDRAVQQPDPPLAVYSNRLLLWVRKGLAPAKTKECLLDLVVVLDDIDRALAQGRHIPELSLHAARLRYRLHTKAPHGWKDEVLKHLRAAHVAGADLHDLRADDVYKEHFKGNEEFERLTEPRHGVGSLPQAPRLLNPFDE